MNNKRILIVGVLAVIVTLMVGYALFSETITINGTATAKGDFSITASCQTGITESGILEAYGLSDVYKEAGYDNDTCSISGNKVSMSVNLKYPGAGRFFTISMKNTGTMDAVAISNGDWSFKNGDMEIRNNSDNSLFKSLKPENNEYRKYLNEVGHFERTAIAAIKTSTGEMFIEHSDEWQNRILDSNSKTNENEYYLKLEPNDTLIIFAVALWDEEATLNGYNSTTNATGEIPFKQVTSDMFLNPEGFTCYIGC